MTDLTPDFLFPRLAACAAAGFRPPIHFSVR